jgi:hypothetical protein
MKAKQAWIHSPFVDGLYVLSPPFLCLLIILLLPGLFVHTEEVSLAAWVVLVLLIDVSHVYSTLYRTYFDRETFSKQKALLMNIPLIGLVVGVTLYTIDGMLFWRVLAYTAVFHFIRQQYGFMRIYSRKEQASALHREIDRITVYACSLYPVLHWHITGPRSFNWFLEGDFFYLPMHFLDRPAFYFYLLILGAYTAKEIAASIRTRTINIPKNLVIAGTALSWYFGIVHFNGDLSFTLLNVVSHGIPYMALVWIYGRRKQDAGTGDKLSAAFFGRYGVLLFLGGIFLLAFVEEGLWDALIWKEHREVFSLFGFLPAASDKTLLSVLVPLLALPQITHYILDGFIWKVRGEAFWEKKSATANSAPEK